MSPAFQIILIESFIRSQELKAFDSRVTLQSAEPLRRRSSNSAQFNYCFDSDDEILSSIRDKLSSAKDERSRGISFPEFNNNLRLWGFSLTLSVCSHS